MSRPSSRAVAVAAAVLLCTGLTAATPSPGPSGAAIQVHGEPSANGAPLLDARTGRYRDVVPGPDQVKYYQVRRTMPKSTIYAGVGTRRDPDTDRGRIDVTLETLDGVECSSDDAWDDYDQPRWYVTTGVSSWAENRADRSACTAAKQLVLRVEQVSDTAEFAGTAMELAIGEEPAVTNTAQLPAPGPTTPPPWSTMASPGRTRKQAGGATPGDGPALEPGRYLSTIAPGQLLFFRVDVGWGERLQAHVRVRPQAAALHDKIDSDQQIGLQLIAPGRLDAGTSSSEEYVEELDPDATVEILESTWPVSYNGRNSTDWNARGASLAGSYHVVVVVSDDDENENYRVPFELQIGVLKQGAAKAPSYAGGRRPIGPAWPGPAVTAPEGPGWAPLLLGSSGLAVFAAGVTGLVLLRRTRPRTSPSRA